MALEIKSKIRFPAFLSRGKKMYQKHAESIIALSSQIRNKQKTLRVGSKLWSKRSEIVIFDNCQLRVVMHFPRR